MIQAYHAIWIRPKDTQLKGVAVLPSAQNPKRLLEFWVWSDNLPSLALARTPCFVFNVPKHELQIGARCSFRVSIGIERETDRSTVQVVVDDHIVEEWVDV